ncbi:MAG: YqgE/AlgH family protein [Rhodothermales bacterium]|nr:YqgE/AlgH family protein [Rhodothermales bacterium]
MTEKTVELKAGVLLVAPPVMADPNFRRSVVLLCDHDDEGSFGLILNRPLKVEEVELSQQLDGYMNGLSFGGPVQPNTLHFIHQLGDYIEDGEHITDSMFWGGDFDHLKRVAATRPLQRADLKFFLGYSGWSEGQLEAEAADGAWIIAPSSAEIVFEVAPEKMWSTVLRRLGGEYAWIANFPADPRLN